VSPSIPTLLREVNAALLELCRSLRPDDWSKPTVHPSRDVKDLVAHLLDGSLRRLSIHRDGQFVQAPDVRSFEDMVAFVQRLNTEWMTAAKRLSPRVLVELVERADEEIVSFFESLDPEAPSPFGVAWAGEEWSANAFDVAREYTEKWHHQQQIRDAVGKPGLTERRYLRPVLETFFRGAPYAYRNAAAEDGAGVLVVITGEAGGRFHLFHDAGRWQLAAELAAPPKVTIELDQSDAWRLFTKGIDRRLVRERARVTGDETLAEPLFAMVTIMA
jgi:uncharacterized protein (TIGR03083 family)